MSVRLSNSSVNKFMDCGQAYNLSYNKKLVSKYKGSALFFGSAIDDTLNEVLEDFDKEEKQNYYKVFDSAWTNGRIHGNQTAFLPTYEDIKYSKKDFDADLLQEEDLVNFQKVDKKFNTEVGLDIPQFIETVYKEIKEKGFGEVHEDTRSVYNYAHWLSMRRKGHLMIDAYIEQILPDFGEILSVQKKVELQDDEGNGLLGYVDFIPRLKDGTILLPDNKTSGRRYTWDEAGKAPQLLLYRNILNSIAESDSPEWRFHIDKVGFYVLYKNLVKKETKTCVKCGVVNEGSHKTCPEPIDADKKATGKNRCNGDFEKSYEYAVETDKIINKPDERMSDIVMENIDNVVRAIKNDIYIKNFNACETKYGTLCDYYELCHKGSEKGLVTK